MEELTKQVLILIGSGMGAALAIAGVLLYRNILNWHAKKITDKFDQIDRQKRQDNPDHKLESDQMFSTAEIREELVELRATVDCDRACLFRFHNGRVFTTKEPVWKVSVATESAARGVTYAAEFMKNVDVSNIIETIHVLWPGSKLGPGIEVISPEYCNGCQASCKVDNNNKRRIIFIDVEKLENSYSKTLLIQQGIKYLLDVPVFDADGNISGFVTTNYDRDMNIEEVKQTAYDVCKKTLDIEFMLREMALEYINEEDKKSK